MSAVLWGNWRLDEDGPTFYLFDEPGQRSLPGADTPCLGAAVWTIERLTPETVPADPA